MVFPRVLLATALFAVTSVYAADPWDAAPFALDPKDLLAAAEKMNAGKSDVVMLLDEERYTYQTDGTSRADSHLIYRVVTEGGVDDASSTSAAWAPWYEERPTIQARVVAKDGTVRTLAPEAIVDATAQLQPDIFSDERVARAPLPGVAAGSVIELLITHTMKSVFPGAGQSSELALGRYFPVEHYRLILDSPASQPPHVVNTTGIAPRTVDSDGRRQLIFDAGRTETLDDHEMNLPPDARPLPTIAFSNGTSWHDIAAHYAEMVDKQIASADFRDVVAAETRGAKGRNEVAARLLAYVERNVHYAGVEVAEGSIVPRPPKSVLSNKYGDCKDKATLLVALLRAAGLPAHVALLDAGWDFDVLADAPALSGFNHAIAVVDGAPALWIDPTDEFSRAGELPMEDQGRMALIAKSDTTGLTRTPESPSSVNRNFEIRTVTLPEEGRAHIVEVTGAAGASETRMRRFAADSDAAKRDDALKEYAQNYYIAKSVDRVAVTDPRDLTKPYSVTLEVSKSKNGVIRNGDGSVAINLGALFGVVPAEIREEKNESADAAVKAKKRVHDFLFPIPTVKEWTYRIVPPAGYKPRTLPQSETKPLGTTTLTQQFSSDADGVVTAKFTFDTGKRRISAAEFEQTRVALAEAVNAGDLHIGFSSVGQAKLDGGDVRGALDEFRRLAALHPKEAEHHDDIARALLAGGLGEAARDEARLAVSIEPSSARAHAMLSWVLQHDQLGRHLRQGFDLAGAIAEQKKAVDLDPTDIERRAALAELLSFGDDAYRFGHNARLADSIAEYEKLLKDYPNDAKGYEPPLMLVLAHAGKWDEVQKHMEHLEPNSEQQKLFRILIAAATRGGDAALHELDAYDAETRRQYAGSIAHTLLGMRRYPEAAAMLAASVAGSPNASDVQPMIDALKTTKPDDKPDDGTAKGVAVAFLRAVLKSDIDAMRKLVDDDMGKELKPEMFSFSARTLGLGDLPPVVFGDLMGALIEVHSEGDDKSGYRLRARAARGGAGDLMTLYVDRDKSRYVIKGVATEPQLLGNSVLQMVAAGRLDAARTWLNWEREVANTRSGDEPLDTTWPFAALWHKDTATATADEIRLAAATLVEYKKAEPILTAAREKATDEQKMWIDAALLIAATRAHESAKALEVGDRLEKAHPLSEMVFMSKAAALLDKDPAAIDALAAKRLEKLPHDHAALRMQAMGAAKRNDYAAAAKYAARIIDELSPEGEDYNNAAWIALFTGKDIDKAIDWAHRASAGRDSAASLHTLASLYAAAGKVVDAREALLKSLDARNRETLHSSDWYVIGRIAEDYGVHDAAVAAYKRVEKDEFEDGLSTWKLAQARLK